MANYTALVTAWNSSTLPSSLVTGTPLSSGMTTAQKIATVNAWTVTGPAIPMVIPTYSIYNCILPSEFAAETATNQQLIRDILGLGSVDVSNGTSARTRIVSVFTSSTQTFTNLVALAKPYDTPSIPWVTALSSEGGAGLASLINKNDLDAAGGLT